jgi:hypothetical protein
MDPSFLTLDEVLEIHEEQIGLHGGSLGLRDARALESAVATPMATFDSVYLHASIPAMARRTSSISPRIIHSWTATSGPARRPPSFF